MNTTTRTVARSTVALALGSALLAACGSAGSAEKPKQSRPEQAQPIEQQAEHYVGDPWERRYRQQFWADQHIHDSWNRCHLGENVEESIPLPMGC